MSVNKLIMAALIIGLCFAGGTSRADEEALFATELAPDALIILDLSGSMAQNPAGGSNIYGNSSCSGTFYEHSGTGHTTDCSKIAIAKRSIFNILDDTGDGYIKADDETSLNVRIGYMRYYNGDDQAGEYSSGANKLSKAIGITYRNIFCNASSSSGTSSCSISSTCSSSWGGGCSSSTACVNSECASGGTPLAASLNEAKLYLDYSKSIDTAAATCRQKFAIIITDGADTYACSGNGTETQSDMYKRRRATVAAAKALGDAGYTLFVIGFGSLMPAYSQNTLNWMAYYGGTENPLVANSGDTTAFNPAGITITSCGDSATTGTCDGNSTNCYATSNDPGNLTLSGYAFIASDADEIANQLQIAFNVIRQANYSFSQSSIQLNRTTDENFIYEGSFQPVTGDPFWLGHLKKYNINTNGTIGNEQWDAGTVLMNTAASARNIKTYKDGAMTNFTTANLTNANLAVTSDTTRTQVVGYIRGESAYNPENWKLGDIFRSKPITVGTPSLYYVDTRDTNSAFDTFRSNHTRNTSPSYSGRVVLVGANDGQLHAFKTSDGTEAWSFIPPNQLSRLKMVYHVTHPTTLTHQSYIDGPLTVADAWVPATSNSGTAKSASDWQTLLMFGEGQGVGSNVWSSSQYCDSGFNTTYSSTYQYFCGYYCLNVTNTLSPTTCGPTSGTQWLHLTIDSTRAPYIGAPWSTPMIGKVMDGGNEKWVAVIGGGKTLSGATNSGKGLFVINLIDGSLLWSYTYANNNALNYPMPAAPAIVDTDNDGFIDTVYIGDLGGNIWRFKFCRAADGTSCSTSSWTGGRFFEANSSSGTRPIYDPSVAKDSSNNIWVYWGTGDKTDPTSTTYQEKFFALKDTDLTSTRTISDMENITSLTSYSGSGYGFYLNLTGSGEKILSDTTVYGGVVYFTTFTPASTTNLCVQGGSGKLYGINFTTGAAALNVTGSTSLTRSTTIGTGIPSAPVISLMDGSNTPDLYVTTSGGGGVPSVTERANVTVNSMTNRTNMLFWRDTRIE